MIILLLFPFHASQIWNGGDYSGFYVWSHTNNIFYVFSTAVYPWFMTLLFVIAGMSTKYALQKRSAKKYINERCKKLLIPFLFGTLILAPIMTYIAEVFFNGYTGSYLEQYILFFTKETDLTGYHGGFTPAHFWFLIYLFLISVCFVLLLKLKERFLPKFHLPNINYAGLLLLFLPVWLALHLLNIGGKSFGQFFVLFIIGYGILSKTEILETLKKYCLISISLWITAEIIYTSLYCFFNFRGTLCDGLYVFTGWIGILSLLGIGAHILNFSNKATAYFCKASFPIYIIHQVWVVAVGFFALKYLTSTILQFITIVFVSFLLTIITYELIRRLPVIRTLFGISTVKTK